MAVIELSRTVALDSPVQVEALTGSGFTGEAAAHRFTITATRGGEVVALSGTITGRCLRSDGTTILLTGSITGGKAQVTLPQDCYNVPGRIQLVFFNQPGSGTGCIYAAVATVQRSSGDKIIDSGSVVPSIDDLLAQVAACEAATTAANAAVDSYNALKTIDLGQQNTTVVANKTDYNTLTTPGTYTVTSNGSAAGMTNCPTVIAHKLIVMQVTNSTPHLVQIVIDRNSSDCIAHVWRRVGIYAASGYTWGEWIGEGDTLRENVAFSKTLSRVAYPRATINIQQNSAGGGTVEIPATQLLCGGKEYTAAEATLTYTNALLYWRVAFDTSTSSYTITGGSATALGETEYAVLTFARQTPEQAASAARLTLNGEDMSYSSTWMRGNFQNSGVDDTNFSWWVYPEAVEYHGQANKLYWGYCDSHGFIGVMSYDLDYGTIERKILMKSSTKATVNGVVYESDNHNDCAVNVMADGRILCVCAMHATVSRNHVFISKHPESISEFEDQVDLQLPTGYTGVTYAQVHYLGGKYHMFFRCLNGTTSSGSPHFYWGYRSSADGATWSDMVPLLDGVDYQYYLRTKVQDDSRIALYMQSNASQGATEIRYGVLNVTSGNILINNGASLLGNINTLKTAIKYTSFPVVIEKPASTGYQRMLALGQGEDRSIIACSIDLETDAYTTYYYRWNGSAYETYTLPNQGVAFGPKYQNGAEIVGTDRIVSCHNTGSGWETRLYSFSGGKFTLEQVLDSTSNTRAKMFVPILAKDSRYVFYNRGWFNSSNYYDFFTRIVCKKLPE